MSREHRGWLYVLTNPVMPGLVKVGFSTKMVEARLAELHTTGVPLPFEVAFAALVRSPRQAEKRVHAALAAHRVSKDREFFRCTDADAVRAIYQGGEILDVDPECYLARSVLSPSPELCEWSYDLASGKLVNNSTKETFVGTEFVFEPSGDRPGFRLLRNFWSFVPAQRVRMNA